MVASQQNILERAWSWLTSRLNQPRGDYSQWEENTTPVQPEPTQAQQLSSQLSTPISTPTPEQLQQATQQNQSGKIPDNTRVNNGRSSGNNYKGGTSNNNGSTNNNNSNSWQEQAQKQEAQKDIQEAQSKTTPPPVPENIQKNIDSQQQQRNNQQFLDRREMLIRQQKYDYTSAEKRKMLKQYVEGGKGLIRGAFYAPYDAYQEGVNLLRLGMFIAGKSGTSPADIKLEENRPARTLLTQQVAYNKFVNLAAPDIAREYEITNYDELSQPIKSPVEGSNIKGMTEAFISGGEDSSKAYGYALGSFITQNIIGDWLISKAIPTANIKNTNVQSIVTDVEPDYVWKKSLNINYDYDELSLDFTPVRQPLIPQANSKATTFVQYGDKITEVTGYSKTSFIGKKKIVSGVSEVFSETITSPEFIGKGAYLKNPQYQVDVSTVLKTLDKNVNVAETTSYIHYSNPSKQYSGAVAILEVKGKKGYGNIYSLAGKSGDNVFTGMTGFYSKAKINKVGISETIIVDDLTPSINQPLIIKPKTPQKVIINDLFTDVKINNGVNVVEPEIVKLLPYNTGDASAVSATKTISAIKPETKVYEALSDASAGSAARTSIEQANLIVKKSQEAQSRAKNLMTGMITAASSSNSLIDLKEKNKPLPNPSKISNSPENILIPIKYGKGSNNINIKDLSLIINQKSPMPPIPQSRTRQKIGNAEEEADDTIIKPDTIIIPDTEIETKKITITSGDVSIKPPTPRTPDPIIPKPIIPNPWTGGRGGFTTPLIRGFSSKRSSNPFIKKRESGYSPSFAAVITGFKSNKMPNQKSWTGLELRPMIFTKKEKSKKKSWKLF